MWSRAELEHPALTSVEILVSRIPVMYLLAMRRNQLRTYLLLLREKFDNKINLK